MKRISLLLTTIAFSACSFGGTNGTGSSSSSTSSLPETRNVSYMGTIQPLGPSVYMQGTHQLEQEDGKIVLLESTLLRLDDYVGDEVEVFGAVRPTVEQGGIIMRVDAITILSVESSSSSSDVSSSSSSMSSSSVQAVSSSSRATVVSSVPASSRVSVASSVATSASSFAAGTSADIDARAKAMASLDLSPARWTQQYCTSHIGFCVPIHKNWWYTSFGTSGSALWHVEVSNKEISGLGDGVIVINLMSGAGTDGSVSDNGSYVVAHKAWKDNTHFEISAPSALKAAVTYMAQNVTEYQVSQ